MEDIKKNRAFIVIKKNKRFSWEGDVLGSLGMGSAGSGDYI